MPGKDPVPAPSREVDLDLLNPFGEGDEWALRVMNSSLIEMNEFFHRCGKPIVSPPIRATVADYACVFARVAEHLKDM